jgi:hypothetical protein
MIQNEPLHSQIHFVVAAKRHKNHKRSSGSAFAPFVTFCGNLTAPNSSKIQNIAAVDSPNSPPSNYGQNSSHKKTQG